MECVAHKKCLRHDYIIASPKNNVTCNFFGMTVSYAPKNVMPTILSIKLMISIQYFSLGMSVKIIEQYLSIKEPKFFVDAWVVNEPLTSQTHQICMNELKNMSSALCQTDQY